jgi:redox-sensing transcriptional repressor
MAKTLNVPDIVIGRLPIYFRALTRLTAEGCETTSSQRLGELLGTSSAQIRKDLSHFGEFGKQGMGYNVAFLRKQLAEILNVDRHWNVALVGAGPNAEALLRDDPLSGAGFRIVALFEHRPERVGLRLYGLEIQDVRRLAELAEKLDVKMVILDAPAADAQKVADTVVKAGIRGILSYSPVTLSLPPDVRRQTVDPVALLQRMAYYL